MISGASGVSPLSSTPQPEGLESNVNESTSSASPSLQPAPGRSRGAGALGDLAGMSRLSLTSARGAAGQAEAPRTKGRPVVAVAPVTVEAVLARSPEAVAAEPAKPASIFGSLKAAVALAFASPLERRNAELKAKLKAKLKELGVEPRQIDEAAARAPVTMTINLGTFRENYRTLRQLVPEQTEMSVVLKADAYGVGAGKLATALEKEGCNKFFVATLDEALKMRAEVKPETTVMVLGGPLNGTAKQFLDHDVTPVLNSVEQVREWNELGRETGKKLPAILQFDTGMSRAGIAPEDRAKVAHGSDALQHVDVKYVMSHLATAGEATLDEDGIRQPSPSMEKQHEAFKEIQREYPGVGGSLAASAALHIPEYQKQMVRGGGVIHGQEVFDDGKGTYPQPVRVTGRLAEVREINCGTGIGYGLTYRAEKKTFIGTIPAGYADGLPRTLGGTVDARREHAVTGHAKINGQSVDIVGEMSMDMNDKKNGPKHVVNGHVKINGQLVDIVGRMSMDMTTVDLSHLLLGKMAEGDGIGTDPDLRLWTRSADGDVVPDKQWLSRAEVVFTDKTHTFDDVAREAGLNSSMVSIGLGNSPRVRKVYVDQRGGAQVLTPETAVGDSEASAA
ncbi:MAG: alanine racemase [Paraburkholderia sp.]|nr:alanine racemase [Paraburkholderia sp.]